MWEREPPWHTQHYSPLLVGGKRPTFTHKAQGAGAWLPGFHQATEAHAGLSKMACLGPQVEVRDMAGKGPTSGTVSQALPGSES